MNSPSCNNRRAYTLLEILIAVTLMLMIMYAVSVIFGRVGSIINETQNTMTMANNLRNVAQRLETDLKNVTVPMTPPRHSANNEGFFCYSEGLGASFQKIQDDNVAGPISYKASDYALDSERSKPSFPAVADTTVGDNDDILSFTAKAPPGQPFRGRLAGDIIESDFAEIVWFLRGTTLYRRVLLIVPQDELERAMPVFQVLAGSGIRVDELPAGGGNDYYVNPIWMGYGFYSNFDISVRFEYFDNVDTVLFATATPAKKIVANTLGDLSNRRNRYGYWNSVCDSNINSLHGNNGAWYWLRLPTLLESTQDDFIAGVGFGGFANQSLTLRAPGNSVDGTPANDLPDVSNTDTYIDYWNDPNCWKEIDQDTGDIDLDANPSTPNPPGFDQDVMLTNVLSFDVKAWDENTNQFVDLGAQFNLGLLQHQSPVWQPNPSSTWSLPNWIDWRASFQSDFKTVGRHAPFGGSKTYTTTMINSPIDSATGNSLLYLPAVYDTWTEQYEMEYAATFSANITLQESLARIPTSGLLQSASLEHFPPPYDLPLKAIQVELRIFDPKTKRIRNLTVPVEFTRF